MRGSGMDMQFSELVGKINLLIRRQLRLISKEQDVVIRQGVTQIVNLRVGDRLRDIHTGDDSPDDGCRGLDLNGFVDALSARIR